MGRCCAAAACRNTFGVEQIMSAQPSFNKNKVNVDEAQSSTSLRTLVALLVAVALGAVTAVIVMPIWLPGLSASIVSADHKVFWYLTRASAIVAYVLIWA